jgi:hypothetical protein
VESGASASRRLVIALPNRQERARLSRTEPRHLTSVPRSHVATALQRRLEDS